MDHLTDSFEDLSISKATVYRYMADLWVLTLKQVRLEPVERNTSERMEFRKTWVKNIEKLGVDYLNNCVFIDGSGFHTNLNRTKGWSPKGERTNKKVLTARANTISILGAVSAKGVIKISLRKPIPPSKKRKLQGGKQLTKGTTSNHFMNFILQVLKEMDKFPEMKGHYLIKDNASIHKDEAIMKLIERRGYNYLYLPPYSPELNPIEQFWSVLKAFVKNKFDLKKDTLTKSITEGAHNIPKHHFEGFTQHSIKRFEDCLAKHLI
jgi:transposase